MIIAIEVDTEKLQAVAEEGGQLVLRPEAEDALIKLLTMQEQVNGAVDFVKAKIEEMGLALNPNFQAVVGDKIKANYQAAGASYAVDKDRDIRDLPRQYRKRKVTYALDSDEIKAFEKRNRRLPKSIYRPYRTKRIVLRVSQ